MPLRNSVFGVPPSTSHARLRAVVVGHLDVDPRVRVDELHLRHGALQARPADSRRTPTRTSDAPARPRTAPRPRAPEQTTHSSCFVPSTCGALRRLYFAASAALRSAARAPPRIPYIDLLPSWHAYSYISSSATRCDVICTVHGCVNASGSFDRELVEEHVVGDARESLGQPHVLARAAKRRIGAPVPRLDDQRIAVPRPRELPRHWRISSGGNGRPSSGMIRVSCTISLTINTWSSVCTSW